MEIKITKAARLCAVCERAFVHDEEVHSLVRLIDEGLAREDYCGTCWEPARANGAYSLWTPKYYDPQVAEQGPPEVFSPLRQLFYESVETEDRHEQAKAFLAAQLLHRQKVFRRIKESDESDGEVRIILYADRIGNRLIEVRDPSFTYAEMETARRLLIQGLEVLEAPEKAEEEAEHAEFEEQE